MRRHHIVLILLGAACTQDGLGPTFKTVADLAGRWTLTQLELTGVADPSQKVDLKTRFGISATLTIATGGQAVLTASVQGSQSVDTATIALHGDTLIYSRLGGSALAYVVSGSRTLMTWTAVATDDYFDLDGDGTGDESREIDGWQR